MREVTHEKAMEFLDHLLEKMPDWTFDNWDPEIEYIKEVLWRDNDMRNS